MQNDQQFASAGVARLCWLIRACGWLIVGLTLMVFATTYFWPDLVEVAPRILSSLRIFGASLNGLSELSAAQRLLIAAIGLPYLAALTFAFIRLDRMLRSFQNARFFELATIGHLRAFAGWLLVAKALSLAAMHVRVAALIQMLGEQHVHTVVNISSDGIAVLLLCALLFLIARMMEVGRELADENRGFV